METYTCENCGAQLTVEEGKNIAFCEYCGTKVDLRERSEELAEIIGKARQAEGAAHLDNILKRAFMFIHDRDFNKAYQYCEKALDMNPECGRAHFYKFMAELTVSSFDELKNSTDPVENMASYKMCCDSGTKNRLLRLKCCLTA